MVWLVLGLFVLGLHLAYLLETLALPFAEGPQFDSLVYLAQAKAVQAGQHGHPTLLAMSPLYGYWLALWNTPTAPVAALAAQTALGVLSVGLTARLAYQLSGRRQGPAVAAALIQLGYGWLMFIEGKLVSEITGTVLVQASWLLMLQAPPARTLARAGGWLVGAGALLALAVLARASLIFALPLVALAAAWLHPAPQAPAPPPAPAPPDPAPPDPAPPTHQPPLRPRRLALRAWAARGACVLAFALGALLVLGARGLITQAHSGVFVPVVMVSKTVEHSTAAAEWRGNLTQMMGRAASAWDVVDQARARLAEGADRSAAGPLPDLVGWARNLPAKLMATLRDWETGFDYAYYGERGEVLVLRILPVTFWWLLLLGSLGAGVMGRQGRWRLLLPGLALALGALATTTLYHPSSRYRLGLVLALLPLAGIGGACLVRTWRLRPKSRIALVPVVAVLVWSTAATWTYRLQRPADWPLLVAQSALAAGWLQEAERRACTLAHWPDTTCADATCPDATCTDGTCPGVPAESAERARLIIRSARMQLGLPYTAARLPLASLCGAPTGR